MDDRYIRVEYDKSFSGGDYSGVGTFAFVPQSLVSELGSVEAAFEKAAGVNRIHMIHYTVDVLYDAQGRFVDEDDTLVP
jgi:hypothetical protein